MMVWFRCIYDLNVHDERNLLLIVLNIRYSDSGLNTKGAKIVYC